MHTSTKIISSSLVLFCYASTILLIFGATLNANGGDEHGNFMCEPIGNTLLPPPGHPPPGHVAWFGPEVWVCGCLHLVTVHFSMAQWCVKSREFSSIAWMRKKIGRDQWRIQNPPVIEMLLELLVRWQLSLTLYFIIGEHISICVSTISEIDVSWASC